MKTCSRCGGKYSTGNFCPICGARLSEGAGGRLKGRMGEKTYTYEIIPDKGTNAYRTGQRTSTIENKRDNKSVDLKSQWWIPVLAIAVLAIVIAMYVNKSKKPTSMPEYSSVAYETYSTSDKIESTTETKGYASVEELKEAGGFNLIPFCILRDGMFYPIDIDVDGAQVLALPGPDTMYYAIYGGFVTTDDYPIIRLNPGDKLISVEDLNSGYYITKIYQTDFLDYCSPLYLRCGHGASINDCRYPDNTISLNDICGEDVEIPNYYAYVDEYYDVIDPVLERNGFYAFKCELSEQSSEMIICGNYGDSFFAGGYDGVVYSEAEGIVNHRCYAATYISELQNLQELTKDGYANISLAGLPSGIYFVTYRFFFGDDLFFAIEIG